MRPLRIAIVGGGAAGFFAALACAQAAPNAEITILEKGPRFLAKVKISGGGRCNVTHACFEARELAKRFPRGEHALRGPFQVFQAADTVEWFKSRGVKLYTQDDGCLFPETDSSQTIIDCFLSEAKISGIRLRTNAGVDAATKRPDGCFELTLAGGEHFECDRMLLATGGCRVASMGELAVSLGHSLEPPVPSLFTFHLDAPWVHQLAGIVVDAVKASVPQTGLSERGILLFTHWGLSGPVILRLSAWGARKLEALSYRFPLHLDWLPDLRLDALTVELNARKEAHPAKLVVNTPLAPLTARLWEALAIASGLDRQTRWSALSKSGFHKLLQQLKRTELQVTGKSLNKDEFVTCGGVKLGEVNFKTMQSKICPGLYFAGELLDIDGITGGFNFQAAWTTGWIAGNAMADSANSDTTEDATGRPE